MNIRIEQNIVKVEWTAITDEIPLLEIDTINGQVTHASITRKIVKTERPVYVTNNRI